MIERIEGAVDKIYGYALKRCHHIEEAEDLSQDIILALLASVDKVKEPEKFNGWMWGVAHNVYKAHVRKMVKGKHLPIDQEILTDKRDLHDELANHLEKRRLYHEIAHLSGYLREATKLYYIDQESVSSIAKTLDLSESMVKQYLFQSRKRMKEGMDMFRENGEKSFNPRKFMVHYWGNTNNYRSELFRRKLPGNILLEAYYEPKSVEALTVELGVSSVYIEDEIKILLDNNCLEQGKKKTYQASIPIFTKVLNDEIVKATYDSYDHLAKALANYLLDHKEKVLAICQDYEYIDENIFLWNFSTVVLMIAMVDRFITTALKELPTLSEDEVGYVWGLEHKHGDCPFDMGIYQFDYDNGDRYFGVDYYLLDKKNTVFCKDIARDVLNKAARKSLTSIHKLEEVALESLIKAGCIIKKDDQWVTNIPVFRKEEWEELMILLDPMIDNVYRESLVLLSKTQQLMVNHMPRSVRSSISPIATLKQAENTSKYTMNALLELGLIERPKRSTDCVTTFLCLND